MAGFQRSERIDRAPQEVFDFLTAPENAPAVVPSVRRLVAITDGPVGVGTRYRETRLMRGKEEDAELEVVAYAPGEAYAVLNVSTGIETVYRYAFRPEGDGTRVDLACEVTARGARKLLVPLVVAELKKEDGDHLVRLRQAIGA